MRRKLLFFSLCLILSLSFLLCISRVIKSINWNEVKEQEKRYKASLLNLQTAFCYFTYYQRLAENTYIDNNLQLTDKQGQIIALHNLDINPPILVFRFSENNCEPCYIEQLEILRRIHESDSLKVPIVVLTSFSSFRDLKVFLSQEEWILKYNIFNLPVSNDGIALDSINQPYSFVLDESFQIHDISIHDKSIPCNSEHYLMYLRLKYNPLE